MSPKNEWSAVIHDRGRARGDSGKRGNPAASLRRQQFVRRLGSMVAIPTEPRIRQPAQRLSVAELAKQFHLRSFTYIAEFSG
ncbi:hypothetical protein [Sinomonas halotolerans]|uniref:Uncharacterized protein n=1 Tax=Sinomonas halotolerans TaxID=1644133 RepID=A0ABU9X173_9MICC